jgi:hypothetical protein
MTAPLWAASLSRLFLVAYDGADGRPYALAVSDKGVATKLARRFAGEVIDTQIDVHADLAADSDDEAQSHNGGDTRMKTFSAEVTWRVPEHIHLTIEAETREEAIEKALAEVACNPDRYARTLDYDNCGSDAVTGLWEGDEAYPSDPAKDIPLPRSPVRALEEAIEAAVQPARDGWSAPPEIHALLKAFDAWREAR